MQAPRKWSPASAAAALGILGLIALFFGWAWVRAWWVYGDPTEPERRAFFNDAIVGYTPGGVAARLERGGMAILARSDIAEVGASRCSRGWDCLYSRRRSGCTFVRVTYTCTYAVKLVDGTAATAVAQLEANPAYEIGVNLRGSPRPLLVSGLRLDEARDKLCERGFTCARATTPDAHAASPRQDVVPAPPPPAPPNCKGIRADVAGKGETCLDPGDPARREFQDCNGGFCGPAMVALPSGRYLRGLSPADVARALKDDPRADTSWFRGETPQRVVTIGYHLAVGKFEATLDMWNACVADGACAHHPGDRANPARGARPVIGVSWNDVTDGFLPWLNRRLGLSGANAYRLLTEAEWEYAARAGTTTKYAFGDIISTAQARFSRIDDALEVGSFAPNGFGLHDMHGNAPEWVQDCFENTAYDDAPVDGSVHRPRDCRNRAVRGGSWTDHPKVLTSAERSYGLPDDRRDNGFRVARTLAVR